MKVPPATAQINPENNKVTNAMVLNFNKLRKLGITPVVRQTGEFEVTVEYQSIPCDMLSPAAMSRLEELPDEVAFAIEQRLIGLFNRSVILAALAE